jgi:chorismate mutase / prephenate dehydratase
MNEQLLKIREQIDSIDSQLLEMLNHRMELVREVGQVKRSTNTTIYRPDREKFILDRLEKLNKGLLSREAIESIFLEIFAVSRHLELPERVAFLGPEGSFTHQAAESRFGQINDYVPLSSIASVFESVVTRRVKFGVVPIENNREGTVSETIDLLGSSDVKIVAEIPMFIHFALAAEEDKIHNIKRIYSKDIAFGQCRKFLQEYIGHEVEMIPVTSTSKAAELAKNEPHAAAICSEIAAKLHGLPVLFNNIEDSASNRTRFLIISQDFVNEKGSQPNKTSIIAKVAHEAGSLANLLQDFNIARINLCKIESRPNRGGEQFHYWFLIDFEGHYQDENVKFVMEKNKDNVRWLGSYVLQC